MLYTRKGDKGTTKTFSCTGRISKNSPVAEALGTLDEVNAFLGIVKVKSTSVGFSFEDRSFADIVHEVQEDLFIVQAEVAGAPKTIEESKVKKVEAAVDGIEKELPPIKTFFISGGSELAAHFDFARTLARRAERRVIAALEAGEAAAGESTLAYLNRLSSLLYALARLSNHRAGVSEKAPDYR